MIMRIGNLEFMRVKQQAKGKALCPFCNSWAAMDITGHGDCKAVYGRSRSTAIFCRLSPGAGAVYPTSDQILVAINKAIALAGRRIISGPGLRRGSPETTSNQMLDKSKD